MSIGMSIAVAPLTTTVMGAVEERHAGTASGINNAVSRTAGLIAVAVFGVVLLNVFAGSFTMQISSSQIPPDARQHLIQQSGDLAAIKIPEELSSDAKAAATAAIRNSFISGFRFVTLIAATLGVISGVIAFLIIPGKSENIQ